MSLNQNIKDLVTIFDHRTVEIVLEVPENLRALRLLQSTLDKNLPMFFERCQSVTWSLLYLNYKLIVPGATKEKFFREFVPSAVGIEAYKETVAFVGSKLQKEIKVEDLKELQSVTESDQGGAS